MTKKEIEEKIALLQEQIRLLEELRDQNGEKKRGKESESKKTGIVYDKAEFEIEGTVLVKYIGNKRVVEIPNGVTEIGEEAFRYYEKLTKVKIPDSVVSIGDRAFFWCSSIEELELPKNLTLIGDEAFYGCESIESELYLPLGITEIGGEAFARCTKLYSVYIPESVSFIGKDAFDACKHLTAYCAADEAPDGWHSDWANESIWSDSHRIKIFWGYNDRDTNVRIVAYDKSIYKIEGSVLKEYTGHEKVVRIPYGVKTVDADFTWNETVEEIIVPDTVDRIFNSFSYCTNLKKVYFGKRVSLIGTSNEIFYGCHKDLTIYWACPKINGFEPYYTIDRSDLFHPVHAKQVWNYRKP